MPFFSPTPFTHAQAYQQLKALLPTSASSAQLEQLPAQIRAVATFSARTASADHLATLDTILRRLINPDMVDGRPREAGEYMSAGNARAMLRSSLRDIGYDPADIDAVPGTLKDLGSFQRMNLILETNTKFAQNYGQRLQGMTPAVLDQFPAQELIREESRERPRDWHARWDNARYESGSFDTAAPSDRGMIALKTSPIWVAISRFGLPYPPFDYGSGMGLRDVDRDIAESLGLIDRDTQLEPLDPLPLTDIARSSLPADPARQPALHAAIMQSLGSTAAIDENGVLHL